MGLSGIASTVFNSMPDSTRVKEFAQVQVNLHYICVAGMLICANLFGLTKKVHKWQKHKDYRTQLSSNGSSSGSKNAEGMYWVSDAWSTTVNLSSSQSGHRSFQGSEKDHLGSSHSSSSKKSMKQTQRGSAWFASLSSLANVTSWD